MKPFDLEINDTLEDSIRGSTNELRLFLAAALTELPRAAQLIREGDFKGGFKVVAISSDGLVLTLTC